MAFDFKLHIFSNGSLYKKIIPTIDNTYIIGSNRDCNVFIDNPRISRHHIQLVYNSKGLFLQDLNSSNGTFVNGILLESGSSKRVSLKDKIQLAGVNDILITIENINNNKSLATHTDIIDKLKEKNHIYLGRSSECDLVLDSDNISRKHAIIERVNSSSGTKYYIQDLGSVNGTFVNGRKIFSKTIISFHDILFIGKFKLSLKGQSKDLSDEIAISATGISKTYKNGFTALKRMDIAVPSKTLLAIMGPTGCGKSTLLKALNGDIKPSNGKIYIYNQELISNYEYLKTQIGYVPQDDIIHKDLTVYQCLYYTAKLRLDNASDKVINKKITDILHELDITFIKNNLITDISGGQRKRVAIGVELLTDPLLLFLDEPTSPLDPQTISNFLLILKRLSENGTTVIMVTHKPDDLIQMDDVLFLSKEGSITYHGSAKEYKGYFNVKNPVEVFSELSPPKSQKWIEKYKSSMRVSSVNTEQSLEISSKKHFSFFSQFYWLTRRYFQIKTNDRFNSIIMLSQAPVIAFLICCIFKEISAAVLFISSISAIWFGTNNAAREIVSENSIYKRERMFNLSIFPYIFSKITVLTFFSIIQTFLFVLILIIGYDGSTVALNQPEMMFFWMLLLSIAATCLGLFLSSLLKTTESVMSFVPLVLLPQIMLAGIISKIDSIGIEILSYFTISRWGTEGFAIIQNQVIQELAIGVYAPYSSHKYILSRFHSSYQDYNLDGDILLDVIAVSFMIILMLILTYISLKKKDSQSI